MTYTLQVELQEGTSVVLDPKTCAAVDPSIYTSVLKTLGVDSRVDGANTEYYSSETAYNNDAVITHSRGNGSVKGAFRFQ